MFHSILTLIISDHILRDKSRELTQNPGGPDSLRAFLRVVQVVKLTYLGLSFGVLLRNVEECKGQHHVNFPK